MTVTVKFSRRAAVAGSLAAATLATAGASGAVSGALADGAGDDGVSGDPGRVGGVDPTDEERWLRRLARMRRFLILRAVLLFPRRLLVLL